MPRSQPFPALQPFRHPRERELAGWLTVDCRLAEVELALEELLVQLDNSISKQVNDTEPKISILIRSLYCFSVVTYVRCFNSGRRTRIKISDVMNVGRKQLELHDELVSVRNQHLAHAVSNEEEAHIFLSRRKGAVELRGFEVINVVLASDSRATTRRFLALVKRVRKYVDRMTCEVGDEISRTYFGQRARWKKLSSWRSSASDA